MHQLNCNYKVTLKYLPLSPSWANELKKLGFPSMLVIVGRWVSRDCFVRAATESRRLAGVPVVSFSDVEVKRAWAQT